MQPGIDKSSVFVLRLTSSFRVVNTCEVNQIKVNVTIYIYFFNKHSKNHIFNYLITFSCFHKLFELVILLP